MREWFTPEFWQAQWEPAMAWLNTHVLNVYSLVQLVGLVLAAGLAMLLAKPLTALLDSLAARANWLRILVGKVRAVVMPVLWLLIQYAMIGGLQAAELPFYILKISGSLLTAWIVITILAGFLENRALSRFIAIIAWSLAALNILGLLDPLLLFLDGLSFSVGEVQLTVLSIITAILTFILLLWGAVALSGLIEQQLSRSSSITPSLQVLFTKLAKITLIAVALIFGMTASGIDLTAFAVFGGAVGLGLGFGLQKVVSNLFSGVILLLDRSIKPGDVIEFGGTYGWINKLAARYTSVVTRSGTEYLIPNEDMITQPVINWSHSNRQVRRAIPVGISYKSDLHKAMALMEEAGRETTRVLENPSPRCLLKGFGDNSVDLELRIWIEDPQGGVSNVASEVLIKIWDKFHANGIEFPFPQRDIHIVSAEGLDAFKGAVPKED